MVAEGWRCSPNNLAERLKLTSIAQPLIFAIQCATTAALRELGCRPRSCSDTASVRLPPPEARAFSISTTAVRFIHSRSLHQELAHLHGGMAVVFADRGNGHELLAGNDEIEIAAFNSQGS